MQRQQEAQCKLQWFVLLDQRGASYTTSARTRGQAGAQPSQLDGTVRELRGMIGSARAKHDQQQWL